MLPIKICIKPIEANLTRDTELVGGMVLSLKHRIPSAKSTSEAI
jgi:hypothetical protein